MSSKKKKKRDLTDVLASIGMGMIFIMVAIGWGLADGIVSIPEKFNILQEKLHKLMNEGEL